jgi:hypothetical protein
MDNVTLRRTRPADLAFVTGLERHPDNNEPYSALAIKNVADPHRKLTNNRVYTGKLDKGGTDHNARTQQKDRVGRIQLMHANNREDLDFVEAGDIVAKDFKITPEVARAAKRNLTTPTTQGMPSWGNGQKHHEGMKRIIEVQRSVGALEGEVDLAKMIDTQFLPDDIKKPVPGK